MFQKLPLNLCMVCNGTVNPIKSAYVSVRATANNKTSQFKILTRQLIQLLGQTNFQAACDLRVKINDLLPLNMEFQSKNDVITNIKL